MFRSDSQMDVERKSDWRRDAAKDLLMMMMLISCAGGWRRNVLQKNESNPESQEVDGLDSNGAPN